MMSYKKVQLGEVATIRGGKRLPAGEDFAATANVHPYIRARDIGGGKVEINEPVFLNEGTARRLARYTVNKGDVCLTIVGANVGAMGVVPEYLDGANLTENAVKIVTNGKADQGFLKYALLGEDALAQMKVLAGGAAQPKLGIYKVETIEFPCPPLSVQKKIAGVLAAYDELIENNTRRIKLLEQMAQALYREWFVRPCRTGKLPKGWETKDMQEVADVIDCLHSKKPEAVKDGKGICLQLFNIADGGKLDLTKKYLISESDYQRWISRIEVSAGDCVVTNVGRIAAVAQIPEGVKAAIGRNMTAIRPKQGILTPTFLIEYLLSPHMEKEVQIKKDGGAIMDALNVKGIIRLSVPMPPFDRMMAFEEIARPMRRRIELLVLQNANLRRTRDLLLPKLISGEVDVSALEINKE